MEAAATLLLQAGECNPQHGGGRRMKARAPPPPNQPPAACKVNSEQKLSPDLGMLPDQSVINMKENLINRTVDIAIVLPNGEEQSSAVHGSKAVMDLLVDLCGRYHLNPAHHTLELQSLGTQQHLSYKPNTLIGALNVQKILLKEKVPEGMPKLPPPKVPEKTVRLVVNFLRTQKAVVRVNPEVPLLSIIPAICEKCEVSQQHLMLLRDVVTGEELELTKSLNELGIKELYAWDKKRVLPSKTQSEPALNYRETRNSSTSCDTTEKEKKRFLGFFRTNKRNNKAEEHLTKMDGDYGSEAPLKSTTSEESLDGITTSPSFPSEHLCSINLGPSHSLGNISGMTANTDIKKRRAPPPPMVTPQLQNEETDGQEKALSQLSQSSSQNELQRKKRRAPAPPTPIMPNRTEEMEDKRQSTIGNGRHVPQKPPRGNTRGPPQLVIPPPPPYPPPDMDPTVLNIGADVTDPTKLVSKRSLQLSRDNIYNMDDILLEWSETETTISGSSCFASEDITEDSGVVSSPSDIVSLDSQNGSMKLRDKSVSAKEMDYTFVVRSSSCNHDEPGNIHQSRDYEDEDERMEATFENEDVFIAARLQQTLAALDKDLAAIDMHDDSDNGSVCSEMNGSTEAIQDVAIAVPVTVIDDVPETESKIHSPRQTESTLISKAQVNEDSPVDPISLVKPPNKNDNAASFRKKEYVNGEPSCLSKSSLQERLFKEEFRHQTEESKYDFESRAASCAKSNKDEALEATSKSRADSEVSKAKAIAAIFELKNDMNGTKEKIRPLSEQNRTKRLPSNGAAALECRRASTKATDEIEGSPSPAQWCQRGPNAVTSYEPKLGLTTFKVVPSKPGVKCFDRDVSLSTGAIKIDEFGNLVTPNADGMKKVAANMTLNETEENLIGRAKAYWRSSSMENQCETLPVCHYSKSVVPTNSSPLRKSSETKSDCLTSLKSSTLPLAGCKAAENFRAERTKPPLNVTQSPVKTPMASVINTEKMELPFQKPQRRTSSLYVASAIAKCMDPPQFKPNQERQVKEEENDEKMIQTEIGSLPKRCIIVAKYCPVETQPATANESDARIFSCNKAASTRLPLGADSSSTANSKLLNQTSPTSCYRRSAPLTTVSSKDCGKTVVEPSLSPVQKVLEKDRVAFSQNREQIGQANTPSVFTPSYSCSITSSSFGKTTRGNPINSGSSELNSTSLVNRRVSEKEEKLGNAPARNETEPVVRDNIYNVFGPKKKFKPVIQKPPPKDTSLHSALMEAIHTAGGKEKLRKVSDSPVNGTLKKPLFTEAENERSALLAAIRGHSGLKKISSCASEELQSFRNAELALQNTKMPSTEQQCIPLPPPLPPPQLEKTPSLFANNVADHAGDARQALLEAIRSGTGAARLRKVPLLV